MVRLGLVLTERGGGRGGKGVDKVELVCGPLQIGIYNEGGLRGWVDGVVEGGGVERVC